MGSAQSAPTPTDDAIEAVRDRREMSQAVALITLSPSECLFDSCWKGDPKAVKKNLRDGAIVDWTHLNLGGRTALHAAAFSGNLECCEMMISAGATINFEDADGRTPKDWAIRTSNSVPCRFIPFLFLPVVYVVHIHACTTSTPQIRWRF